MENKKLFVGKVKIPRMEARFSLTAADLDTLRGHMTEKGQVHLTFVNTPSKADWQKSSTWLEVYSPDAPQESKRIESATVAEDDMPF